MSDEEKTGGEVSADALEAVFAEEVLLEEDESRSIFEGDEDDEGVDIAFLANDEGYW